MSEKTKGKSQDQILKELENKMKQDLHDTLMGHKEEETEINTIPFYSEEDGNFYPLPFLANEGQENEEDVELPDGSIVRYCEGCIKYLFTGPRIYTYKFDFEKRVMTEAELIDDETLLIRTISLDFFNYWDRFSCNQNTYITDLGEELHFCINSEEPEYDGKIVKIIDPDGEVMDFSEVR